MFITVALIQVQSLIRRFTPNMEETLFDRDNRGICGEPVVVVENPKRCCTYDEPISPEMCPTSVGNRSASSFFNGVRNRRSQMMMCQIQRYVCPLCFMIFAPECIDASSTRAGRVGLQMDHWRILDPPYALVIKELPWEDCFVVVAEKPVHTAQPLYAYDWLSEYAP